MKSRLAGFTRNRENFVCENCGTKVQGNGYTDHCPECLYGKHVDISPGDRLSECKGTMVPKYSIYERDGNFKIHYKCRKCGEEKNVKASPDDNIELLERIIG
ncbi:MAG: RNHCP domain-containing protein [Candidatus Marsarchaeota archaeon]|nr:RNHCP domain-containing protein [Candidatus Marsarchaeota archaeon]